MTEKAVDRWGEGHAFRGIASRRPEGLWDKSERYPHGCRPAPRLWIVLNSGAANQPVDDGVDSSPKHQEIQRPGKQSQRSGNCGVCDQGEDTSGRGVETGL